MTTNLNSKMSTRRWGRVTVAVLAAAVALAGCGSDDTATTKAAKPAGAKENTTTAVCTDWMDTSATPKVVTCAVDARGPGGGRIFYDAGTVQSWGRFLEVAPQGWNGDLYRCPGEWFGSSCGVASPISSDKTSDAGPNADPNAYNKAGEGYQACGTDSTWYNAPKGSPAVLLPGAAANLPFEIGTGKANTAVLLNTPACTTAGKQSAAKLAATYPGGGFTDWFLPSYSEMDALWNYAGRNAIGGFPHVDGYYATSSTKPSLGGFTGVVGYCIIRSDAGGCDYLFSAPAAYNSTAGRFVRPIRAF